MEQGTLLVGQGTFMVGHGTLLVRQGTFFEMQFLLFVANMSKHGVYSSLHGDCIDIFGGLKVYK